jgi:hypothetical protein
MNDAYDDAQGILLFVYAVSPSSHPAIVTCESYNVIITVNNHLDRKAT